MTAVFTIISKNYLAFARTLMASVRTYHPEMARFVVLVDRLDGIFDPAKEDFTVVTSDNLPIPRSRWFHFKYTIMELNTAVKPYAIEHLCTHWPIDKLFYLDPDIKVYGSLSALEESLDTANILLMPHLLTPLSDDGKTPGDLEIMRSGAYNLGFIGVRAGEAALSFVRWWQRKLYDHCYIDFSKGLFTDQKWIDLVPGAFPNVHLELSPRYNVAYWNISQRPISKHDGGYTVNGGPLAFFHFSGFDPLDPGPFSKYQNRFTLDDLGEARDLALEYARDVLSRGHEECRAWTYAYGLFDNGRPILDLCRKYASGYPKLGESIADPFSDEGYQSYIEYWGAPAEELSGTAVTRLAFELYKSDPALRRRLTPLDGDQSMDLLEWLVTRGKVELSLPEALTAPIDAMLFSRRRLESDRRRRENDRNIREESARRIEREWNSVPAPVLPLIRQRADEISAVLLSGVCLNEWLGEKIPHGGSTLTRIALLILESRDDLRRQYPEALSGNPSRYLAWLVTYGRAEYSLTAELMHSAQSVLNELIAAGDRVARRSLAKYAGRIAARTVVDTVRGKNVRPASAPPVNFVPVQVNVTVTAPGPPPKRRINAHGVNIAGSSDIAARQKSAAISADLPVSPDHRFLYDVNLIHVDGIAAAAIPRDVEGQSYNIGCISLDADAACSPNDYDEIWVPSRFCYDCVSPRVRVPVLRIPHAVELRPPPTASRTEFGIPTDAFVFFAERHAIAAIDGFRLLSPDVLSRSHLVIATGSADCAALEAIRTAAAGFPVRVLDRDLSPRQLRALKNISDCFVSLHRSTSFGIGIADAMALGKPVIVTGYSGNMDFTNHEDSLLVKYTLKPTDEAVGACAEPDLMHAAECMLATISNRKLVSDMAQKGREYVIEHFAPAVVGAMMKRRIRAISDVPREV